MQCIPGYCVTIARSWKLSTYLLRCGAVPSDQNPGRSDSGFGQPEYVMRSSSGQLLKDVLRWRFATILIANVDGVLYSGNIVVRMGIFK